MQSEKHNKFVTLCESHGYTVKGVYSTNKTKILIQHDACRHEYMVRPNDFQQGKRCPKCGMKSRVDNLAVIAPKHTIEYVKQEIESKSNSILISKIYTGNKDRLQVKCKTCDYVSSIRFNDFQQGYPICKKCTFISRSSLQAKAIEALDALRLMYRLEIGVDIEDSTRFIDIVVVENINNKLVPKFAIEVNGSQHYQAVSNEFNKNGKLQSRDLKVEQHCKDNNLPLLILSYDLTDFKQSIQDFLNTL